MYNKVILAGNLSRDIEIRYTPGGSAIANTGLAVNRTYKAQDGTKKDEVMFIDLTFYGRTAEIANQYLRKGSKVLIDGRLRLDQWTDKDGHKQSRHKVDVENLQLLDGNDSGQRKSEPAPRQKQPAEDHNPAPAQRPHQAPPPFPEMSDEIPF